MKAYLNKKVDVVIDRPLGSKHPKYDHYYPINYGYIPNTISGDGEEIDVYIIGESKPLETYHGKVIAIVERKDDNEDKLVVYNGNTKLSKEDIMKHIEFQEKFFDSKIITE